MTISIDGTDVSAITIDGTAVQEVTVDGDVVWTASTEIDYFDDGDISEYDTSNAGGFTVQQSVVHEGTHALEASSGDSGTESIYSTSGLNAYPSRGDTFEFYVQRDGTTAGDFIEFGFAQQGSEAFWNDGYYLKCQDDSIALVASSSLNTLDTTGSYSFPTGEWTRVECRFDTSGTASNTIEVDHYDANGNQLGSTASGTDSNWDSGNVRWDAGASQTDTIYADTAQII